MKKIFVNLLVISAAFVAPCEAGVFDTFTRIITGRDAPKVAEQKRRETKEFKIKLAALQPNQTPQRSKTQTPEPATTARPVQETNEAKQPVEPKDNITPAPETENIELAQDGAPEAIVANEIAAPAPATTQEQQQDTTLLRRRVPETGNTETNQSKASSTRSSKTATPEPEEDVQLNQVAQETLGTAPAQASTATVETNKAPVPTPAPTAVPTQEPTVQASAPTDANQQQDQTPVPAPTAVPTQAPTTVTTTSEEANAIEKFITSLKTNVWARTGAVTALGATALVTMFIINLRNVVGLVGKARFKAALTKTIHQATAPSRWITKKITSGSKTEKAQAFVALIAFGVMADAFIRAETSCAAQAYNAIAG